MHNLVFALCLSDLVFLALLGVCVRLTGFAVEYVATAWAPSPGSKPRH